MTSLPRDSKGVKEYLNLSQSPPAKSLTRRSKPARAEQPGQAISRALSSHCQRPAGALKRLMDLLGQWGLPGEDTHWWATVPVTKAGYHLQTISSITVLYAGPLFRKNGAIHVDHHPPIEASMKNGTSRTSTPSSTASKANEGQTRKALISHIDPCIY